MTQPIDMSFLIDALEDHSSTASCYLDKQTGEILRKESGHIRTSNFCGREWKNIRQEIRPGRRHVGAGI